MSNRRSSGQTIIALLIFMMLAITLTLTATMVVVANIRSTSAVQNGEIALSNAQAGMENALIRLERSSTYTGETMTLTAGTATITVSGTSPVTVVSVGSYGNFVRTITATATITGGSVTLTSWSETP